MGKKKSVAFRTREGVQAAKDKVVTKMRACMVCRILATEEQVKQGKKCITRGEGVTERMFRKSRGRRCMGRWGVLGMGGWLCERR